MPSSSKEEKNATLEYAWGFYRRFAATSREQKSYNTTWQARVLTLTLAGSSLSIISQQANLYWILKYIDIPGAIFIALAAYFSKEFIKPENEQTWVQARSLAEATKSEVYRYVTRVSPYDSQDSEEFLNQKVKELEKKYTINPKSLSPEKKRERMPSNPLPIKSYVEERVNDQISNYYNRFADAYEHSARKWNNIRWILGSAVVVLGILRISVMSDIAGISNYTGGIIALIGTATAAIAAHVSSSRYSYLVLNYRQTAWNLERVLSEWKDNIITDNLLVNACEDIITTENRAWMLEMYKKEDKSIGVPMD